MDTAGFAGGFGQTLVPWVRRSHVSVAPGPLREDGAACVYGLVTLGDGIRRNLRSAIPHPPL